MTALNFFAVIWGKPLFAIALAVVLSGSVHAQTKERSQILAPVGQHARDVRRSIEFEARDCSSYSAGFGIGCMTRSSEDGLNIIALGSESPCRKNGTVQLDFTQQFYLVAVTCGSNKESLERFIKRMNVSYGSGESEKGAEYAQTEWKFGKTTVRASERVFGPDMQYRVMVHKSPQ